MQYPYRPSSAGRDCPSWGQLAEGLPDPGSEIASQGDRVHSVGAFLLAQYFGTDLPSHPEYPLPPEVADEEWELGKKYAEEVQFQVARITEEMERPPDQIWIEEKLPPDDYGIFDEGGTVDFAATWKPTDRHGGFDFIVDAKTGWEAPFSKMVKTQLSSYWILLGQENPCYAMWINPRTGSKGAYEFQVEDWREEIDLRLEDKHWHTNVKTEMNLRPHPDSCRYCPAKGICPALRLQVVEHKKEDTAAVPLERLEEFLAWWPTLKEMREFARNRVIDAIESGCPSSFKLVETRGRRAIASEQIDEVFEELNAEYGISAQELLRCGKFSFTKVRDLLMEELEGTKKDKTTLAETVLKPFTVEGKPAVQLRRK